MNATLAGKITKMVTTIIKGYAFERKVSLEDVLLAVDVYREIKEDQK